MPILNYTTKISGEKTAGEIQAMLAKSGAQAVLTEFEDGEVVAISFRLSLNGQPLSFRLPVNSEGVLRALANEGIRPSFVTPGQAKRTAWRIIKDWIASQLALVEANQADLAEVFLPYLQDDAGITIYNKLKAGEFKMLRHQS